MKQAVNYAYVRSEETRPSISDQLAACRAFAEEHGYTVVGEFNDIDTSDHPSQNAGIAAVQAILAKAPDTVVLSYNPNPTINDLLTANGATLEAVPELLSRAART